MDELADELSDVVEEERRRVLAGDLDGLARLAERKADLVGRLSGSAATAEAVQALRAGLERNAGLLAAAGLGVRDALARMSGLRAGGAPLVTYDGQGRRNTLGTAGTVARKA